MIKRLSAVLALLAAITLSVACSSKDDKEVTPVINAMEESYWKYVDENSAGTTLLLVHISGLSESQRQTLQAEMGRIISSSHTNQIEVEFAHSETDEYGSVTMDGRLSGKGACYLSLGKRIDFDMVTSGYEGSEITSLQMSDDVVSGTAKYSNRDKTSSQSVQFTCSKINASEYSSLLKTL